MMITLAHQGGWDEALMVLIPALLTIVRRRSAG